MALAFDPAHYVNQDVTIDTHSTTIALTLIPERQSNNSEVYGRAAAERLRTTLEDTHTPRIIISLSSNIGRDGAPYFGINFFNAFFTTLAKITNKNKITEIEIDWTYMRRPGGRRTDLFISDIENIKAIKTPSLSACKINFSNMPEDAPAKTGAPKEARGGGGGGGAAGAVVVTSNPFATPFATADGIPDYGATKTRYPECREEGTSDAETLMAVCCCCFEI